MKRVGIFKRSGFANLAFGAGAMRVLLKCLKYNGIEVVKLIGSSGGSFAIPLEAVGLFDEVLDACLGLAPKTIVKIDWEALFHPFNRPSLFDSSPLRKYARSFIEPNLDQIFSEKAIPFEIIATDLKTGNGVYFKNIPENKDRLVDICMASAAIVPFLPPVEINALSLVDGAFSDDMPIKRFVDSGCDFVFVVDVYNGMPTFDVPFEKLYWRNLILRTTQVSIHQHSRLRLDANERINREVKLDPTNGYSECEVRFVGSAVPFNHVGFREFNNFAQKGLVEMGYWAAKTALNKLGIRNDIV